jgi:hypothetical protein
MYIMHSRLLSYIYEQLLLKPHFQNPQFSKLKTLLNQMFLPNVLKWIIKKIVIISSLFAFLIINLKILSNFQKEWCTFDRKKMCLKKTWPFVHF